tara:strand:+ start:451 stop:927 length:477 start_codon:yes stop_codon:yes gene_type:complete
MAGTPIRRAKRAREYRMFDDPEFWEKIFDGYSEFGSLPKMARELDIPYKRLYYQISSNDDLNSRYMEAKKAYAEMTVSQIQDITDKLERGHIDPASAKTIISAKQWVASKYAPVQYGERQTIDMQVSDATQLHLEALRQQMRLAKDITPKKKQITQKE